MVEISITEFHTILYTPGIKYIAFHVPIVLIIGTTGLITVATHATKNLSTTGPLDISCDVVIMQSEW